MGFKAPFGNNKGASAQGCQTFVGENYPLGARAQARTKSAGESLCDSGRTLHTNGCMRGFAREPCASLRTRSKWIFRVFLKKHLAYEPVYSTI